MPRKQQGVTIVPKIRYPLWTPHQYPMFSSGTSGKAASLTLDTRFPLDFERFDRRSHLAS